MSWLDFGWFQRGNLWEFHPWGPFGRGYQMNEREALQVQRQVRRLRLAMLLGAGGVMALAALAGREALFLFALLWGVDSGVGASLVKGRPRVPPLGWEAGFLYLVRWVAPKLLTVAQVLTFGMMGAALYLIWRSPGSWSAYLLLGAMVGLRYFLLYLKKVERF